MSNDGTNTPDPYGQPAGQPDPYGQTNPAGQPDPYGQTNPYGRQDGYGAPVPGGPVEQPSSIRTAVLLMRIGALLSLLSLLSAFLFRDSMRDTVEEALRSADPNVSSGTIDAALAFGTGIAVVSGLIGIALWLWMASANGKGRSWARIVASIFFGLSVFFTLVGLAQPQPAIQRITSFVSLILGAVIIFLLWKKESTAYYNSVSASRVRY